MEADDQAHPLKIRDEVVALKRARTVTAAVELFYENGYDNTTLDAIAERMGVTKPFIYSHFSSKTELLAEICSRGISLSLEAIDSVISLNATPTEKLGLLSRRFVVAVLSNQMPIAILTREEKNLAPTDLKRIGAMRRNFDKKLTALLRDGCDANEFGISDPHMAALAIGGMVSWAYVWYRQKGRLSIEEVAHEMTGLIMQMVRAKTSRVRPIS